MSPLLHANITAVAWFSRIAHATPLAPYQALGTIRDEAFQKKLKSLQVKMHTAAGENDTEALNTAFQACKILAEAQNTRLNKIIQVGATGIWSCLGFP